MSDAFELYRLQSGYSEKSIRVQNSHVNRFKSWCNKKDIQEEATSYGQVLEFIENERGRGLLNQSIIREINSVRIYFDYLLESGKVKHNIIRRVKIRQSGRMLLPEIITVEKLEKIYQNYLNVPSWKYHSSGTKLLHQRNTVILGLLIYQGATTGELAKMEPGHVNLDKGKVYIPSTKKSNPRVLQLNAKQIISLKTYLEQTRKKLLENQDRFTSHLLIPVKKHSTLVSSILHQVKRLHPQVENSRHIRSSVIMNWLTVNNLRQVQYMAGHKSIRSTEAYRSQDISNLTRQLELFHPLQ